MFLAICLYCLKKAGEGNSGYGPGKWFTSIEGLQAGNSMKFIKLPSTHSEQPLPLSSFAFEDIVAPALHKGKMAQTHYFFPASSHSVVSFQVELKGTEEGCTPGFEETRARWSVAEDAFPYGLSEAQWWEYCLAPHSYLALEDGKCQVGLNLFSRFLHLDLNEPSALLVDPGVGNELVSTTNWFDHEKGELWFASWPVEATVRRILNPRDGVVVTIWKLLVSAGVIEKVWQGDLADALHQLCLDPLRRFVILTELGLRLEAPIPAQSSDQAPRVWEQVQQRGVVPSKILVLDLKTGQEWRLSTLTAAHVEFDPQDPGVCYLSGHNIGLIGVKVGIFGPGIVQKFRLGESGPDLLGEFTHNRFHRITTHIVFCHRGKTLIGVSGYPGTVFLINGATMKLHRIIEMDSPEKVDTSRYPHICGQDSYGIEASRDGEVLLIAGTGFVRVADIDEGRFVYTQKMEGYGADCCFTGHMGRFVFPHRDKSWGNS
jgi:hypothetical protein